MYKILVLVALVASVAFAQDNGGPGYHQHDGFFLAMNLGFGYGSNETDNFAEIDGYKIEGAPFNSEFDIRIGGCIFPNLAVYYHAMAAEAVEFDVKQEDGDEYTMSNVLGHRLSGIGVTYYIMPMNVFVGGTIGLGNMIMDDRYSDNGFAFAITAGKEWWVSDNWGLGFSVEWSHLKTSDDGDWTGSTIAVLFSATYN